MWLTVAELIEDQFLVRDDVFKELDRLLLAGFVENLDRVCDFLLRCVLQWQPNGSRFHDEVRPFESLQLAELFLN